MSTHPEPLEVLRYRLERNARSIEALEDWRRVIDPERATVKEQMGNVRTDLHEVKQALAATNRRLVQLMVTIAVSALGFAFSVLAGTGKL